MDLEDESISINAQLAADRTAESEALLFEISSNSSIASTSPALAIMVATTPSHVAPATSHSHPDSGAGPSTKQRDAIAKEVYSTILSGSQVQGGKSAKENSFTIMLMDSATKMTSSSGTSTAQIEGDSHTKQPGINTHIQITSLETLSKAMEQNPAFVFQSIHSIIDSNTLLRTEVAQLKAQRDASDYARLQMEFQAQTRELRFQKDEVQRIAMKLDEVRSRLDLQTKHASHVPGLQKAFGDAMRRLKDAQEELRAKSQQYLQNVRNWQQLDDINKKKQILLHKQIERINYGATPDAMGVYHGLDAILNIQTQMPIIRQMELGLDPADQYVNDTAEDQTTHLLKSWRELADEYRENARANEEAVARFNPAANTFVPTAGSTSSTPTAPSAKGLMGPPPPPRSASAGPNNLMNSSSSRTEGSRRRNHHNNKSVLPEGVALDTLPPKISSDEKALTKTLSVIPPQFYNICPFSLSNHRSTCPLNTTDNNGRYPPHGPCHMQTLCPVLNDEEHGQCPASANESCIALHIFKSCPIEISGGVCDYEYKATSMNPNTGLVKGKSVYNNNNAFSGYGNSGKGQDDGKGKGKGKAVERDSYREINEARAVAHCNVRVHRVNCTAEEWAARVAVATARQAHRDGTYI